MPRIYVEFSGLDRIGSQCKSAASKVDRIQSDFQHTIRHLDWDVRFASNINSTATQISKKLEQHSNALATYRTNHEDNFLLGDKYLAPVFQSQMSDKQCCCVEDTFSSNVFFCAISDGMGGHNAGEVASRICVEKLAAVREKVYRSPSLKSAVASLQLAITNINSTVCDLSRKESALKGMGATLIIFVAYGPECAILNIGDSRAYHYSAGRLVQITKDNTEGQRMLALGLLTRKELSNFPARKNLSRYIGYGQAGYVLQADEYYPSVDDGLIVLCSDGLSDFLSDTRICEILSTEENLEYAGRQLIDEAVAHPNSDNTTVMLIPLRK